MGDMTKSALTVLAIFVCAMTIVLYVVYITGE